MQAEESTIEGPVNAGSEPEKLWYAVYVKSRHEFRVNGLLADSRIDSFLPTVDRLQRWKDRKKLVTFPLFPGYLFVHIPGSKEQMLSVLKTYGVVRFLGLRPGAPDPVPEQQITALQTLIENRQELEPYPYLREGQRVRIKFGPLAGVEGILRERRGQHLLVLAVDILQQGACVKVSALDVEPA